MLYLVISHFKINVKYRWQPTFFIYTLPQQHEIQLFYWVLYRIEISFVPFFLHAYEALTSAAAFYVHVSKTVGKRHARSQFSRLYVGKGAGRRGCHVKPLCFEIVFTNLVVIQILHSQYKLEPAWGIQHLLCSLYPLRGWRTAVVQCTDLHPPCIFHRALPRPGSEMPSALVAAPGCLLHRMVSVLSPNPLSGAR